MSKSKKGKGAPDSVNWDENLIKEPLKNDVWQPFIFMVLPEQPSSELTLDSLVSAVNTGCRRKFIVLHKESMLLSAKDDAKLTSAPGGGGGRKSKQSAVTNKPLFVEVCQHVVNEINLGEVPQPLLARLIKYNIIKRRTADAIAMEASAKVGEDAVTAKNVSAKGKGGPASGRASKRGKATPGIDAEDIPMPEKLPTTMKKRGEESQESKYIDDEPQGGPSAYIFLHGFNESEIFSHLADIGITVNALVKLTNTATDTLEPATQSTANLEDEEQKRTKTINLAKFWHDIDMMYFSGASTLQDTINFDMNVSSLPPSMDTEENKDFGLDIFSQLSEQIYNVLDSEKQYQHYLHYLDIKDIALLESHDDVTLQSNTRSSTPQERKPSPDMRYYNEQVSKFPEEFVNPAVILNCMLDQVELSLSDNTTPSLPVSLHQDLQKAVSDILFALPVKSSSSFEVNIDKAVNIINELDKASISSMNASQLTLANTLTQEHSLLSRAVTLTSPSYVQRLQYETQLHALRQFTIDIPQLQIDSFFNAVMSMSSMQHIQPPSANDEQTTSLEVASDLLFDYPLNIRIKIPETSTDISLIVCDNKSGLASHPVTPALELPDQFDDLSEYTVLEPLERDVLLQVIQNYQTSHPYIKLYNHRLANSLIVAMYSGYNRSSGRHGKYSWQRHVHSKVGFNNYLKYVAEKVGPVVEKAVEDDNENRIAIEKERAEALAKKMTELQQSQKQEADSNVSSAKSGKKSSSGKKASSGKASKMDTPIIPEEAIDSNIPQFVERKIYTGYNVRGEVLICDGTVAKAFTNDGICITTEKLQFVNKPISLSVSLVHNDVTLSAVIVSDATPSNEESKVESSDNTPSLPIPQPPKPVIYSTFQANFGNTIRLSLSGYGLHGNGKLPVQPISEKELAEIERLQQEAASQPSTRPPSQDKKMSKKQLEDQQRVLEQQQTLEAKFANSKEEALRKIAMEKEIIVRCNKYQQLNLTTLHGLNITCTTMESNEDNSEFTVVTQQYSSPPSHFAKEATRIYFCDGNVLKKNADGNITVLCGDGKVFEMIPNALKENFEAAFVDVSHVQSTTKVSFTPDEAQEKKRKNFHYEDLWLVTLPDGRKRVMKYVLEKSQPIEGDDTVEEEPLKEDIVVKTAVLNPISTYVITDPKTNEVLVTREDNVIILKKPDGSTIVEHADGTRITSKPSASLLVIEHPLFATTTYLEGQCVLNVSPEIEITCKLKGEYILANQSKKYQLSIASNGDTQYTSHGSGSYKINHTNSTSVLSATDSASIIYTVDTDGGIQVTNDNTELNIPINFQPHFFILQSDGLCYEIHSKTRFNSILNVAQELPEALVRSEELDQCPHSSSTTIVLPVSNEEKLLFPYQQETIIPQNLQTIHTGSTTSATATVTKPFGVGVGRALDIGGYKPPKPVQAIEQPKCLKYRHFIQLNESLQEKMKSSLIKYLIWREEKENIEDQALPSEDQMKEVSEQLHESVLSFKGLSSPADLLSYYRNSIENQNVSSSPTQKKDSQFPNKMDLLKQDVEDAEAMKSTIREKVFPPYFQSKDGVAFLHSNTSESHPLSKKLVSFETLSTDVLPLKASEDFTPLSAVPNSIFDPDTSSGSEQISSTASFTKIRPSNPTPNHAQGDGSPTPVRPANPVPCEEVSTSASNTATDKTPSAPHPPLTSSLYYQLSGELRTSPVHLPRSISGSKPGEEPNVKYSEIEEPVRRKVHTSSTSQRAVARGFEIFPSRVNFGILKEGCTYSINCTLKNVGVDTCRFKFKNPPPSTGIRIHYTPGSVVAGMSRKFQIEIFALAVGASSPNEMGVVYHELEITSESNILHLPIQAHIYPLDLFNQHYDHSLAGATATTVLITNRPLSREDLNRPRHQ